MADVSEFVHETSGDTRPLFFNFRTHGTGLRSSHKTQAKYSYA
jgi:hypothetical protein